MERTRSLDITNKTFNKLTAIRFVEYRKTPSGRKVPYWLFLCECGNEKIINSWTVMQNNKTTSCGCISIKTRIENGKKRYKYGCRTDNKREYYTYEAMISRCYNSNNERYKYYGGRGISICKRWLDDFQNFLDDMGKRPENMTIQRINNDGNYNKENCCWATPLEQAATRNPYGTFFK